MKMIKNCKLWIIAILLVKGGSDSVAQNVAFTNDICVTDKVYMLSDTLNTFFVEPIIKRWRPYHDLVRFSGTALYIKRIERMAEVKPKAGESSYMGVSLVNTDEFRTLKSDTVRVLVGEKGAGKEEVKVQILGDSYTDGAFFRDALIDKGYVPRLHLIGLRKVRDAENQYDEGRGGWTVRKYFEIPKGEDTPYHGYMQPDGTCRYWGSTAFWKNCYRVQNGELKGFDWKYNCGRYERCLPKYDSKTGYLLHPRKDDLMFDNQRNGYMVYDGHKWKETEIDETAWHFNYGKYLDMWELEKPDIFVMLLGLNDYRDSLKADYGPWNRRVEEIKRSYRQAVPQGKFVVLIPCSTCGLLDNQRGDFTLRQNAAMWQLRQNIIRTFDGRESEGIYVVDMGITIDNENGYRKNTEGLQTGNPHPYPNYPAMGVPLAAFIQYYRDDK